MRSTDKRRMAVLRWCRELLVAERSGKETRGGRMMDPRSRALSALTRFQVTETSVGETLQQIAEITVEAVSAAAVAGMTMLGEDGQPTTAVYTDEDSPEIDEAQYRNGNGPCLDAWRHKRVIRVADVDACTGEYGAFAEACRAHGVL